MYALIKVEFLIISPHRKKFSTNLPTFNDENTVGTDRSLFMNKGFMLDEMFQRKNAPEL